MEYTQWRLIHQLLCGLTMLFAAVAQPLDEAGIAFTVFNGAILATYALIDYRNHTKGNK